MGEMRTEPGGGIVAYTQEDARGDLARILAAERAFLPMAAVAADVVPDLIPTGDGLSEAAYRLGSWDGTRLPEIRVALPACLAMSPQRRQRRASAMAALRVAAAGGPAAYPEAFKMTVAHPELARPLAAATLAAGPLPLAAGYRDRSPRTRLASLLLHETAHHRLAEAGWAELEDDRAGLHRWLAERAGTPPTLLAAWYGAEEWFAESWSLWRQGKATPGGNTEAMAEAAACLRAGTLPWGDAGTP